MTKQFTKADMKDEYGVLQRDGYWWTWGEHPRQSFNDDLTHKTDKAHDIMLIVDTEGSVQFKREEPKTVIINGIEVVAGVTKPLEDGQEYYIPRLDRKDKHFCYTWTFHCFDYRMLEQGIVQLTKENAIAMANAMLAFDEGGE